MPAAAGRIRYDDRRATRDKSIENDCRPASLAVDKPSLRTTYDNAVCPTRGTYGVDRIRLLFFSTETAAARDGRADRDKKNSTRRGDRARGDRKHSQKRTGDGRDPGGVRG